MAEAQWRWKIEMGGGKATPTVLVTLNEQFLRSSRVQIQELLGSKRGHVLTLELLIYEDREDQSLEIVTEDGDMGMLQRRQLGLIPNNLKELF